MVEVLWEDQVASEKFKERCGAQTEKEIENEALKNPGKKGIHEDLGEMRIKSENAQERYHFMSNPAQGKPDIKSMTVIMMLFPNHPIHIFSFTEIIHQNTATIQKLHHN